MLMKLGGDVSGKAHILIVDDEKEICKAIAEYLTEEGYRVSTAHDGATMRQVLANSQLDLILLDLKFPNDDGLALARLLRNETNVALIIVTRRGDIVDRIVGLEMGADDYLSKPFHLGELLARVKSVLRRVRAASATAQPGVPPTQIHFAGWRLRLGSRDLQSPLGEAIRLTTGEFELLAAFVSNPYRVLTRDRLAELAQHRRIAAVGRTIDVQVGRLRRKLGDDSQEPILIKTVRGIGYIFAQNVQAK
jgi:two-component system, OmpR family, response regulator